MSNSEDTEKQGGAVGDAASSVARIKRVPLLTETFMEVMTRRIVILFVILAVGFSSYYVADRYLTRKRATLANRMATRLEKMVRRDPRNPDTRLALGEAYLSEGRNDAAIEQFKYILKYEPGHQTAIMDLGLAYLEKEDYDKAEKQFKKEITLAEMSPNVAMNRQLERAYYYRGVVLYQKKKYDDAISSLKQSIELEPTSADSYFVLGRAYLDKKDLDTAITAFSEALKYDPAYADAHYGLGLAYERKKDAQKALEEFKKALRYDPKLTVAKEAIDRLTKKKAR